VPWEEFETALCQPCKDFFNRAKVLKENIKNSFVENKEMLDRLGSDYDASGVPYWEKYEERLKYMEDNGI
jgi:hypothetical protein